MEGSNRRPAPVPPLNLQINQNNQNNNNNLNFPEQFDSTTTNNYMNGVNGDVRSSSRVGSNRSTSPVPPSPKLSSNERIESSGGGIQLERSSLRSTSPSSNFNSNSNLTTTHTNPDTAAFSSDYDSPSLSSIASVQTASLLTATRLSSPVLSPTAHLFNGVGIVSPIREERRDRSSGGGGGSGSIGENSSEGDTSRTSGFELVDDVPTTKKGSSTNGNLSRNAVGGNSSGGNGELLSAHGNGNGYLYGDRPSIQQSESYNSIDSNGWRTDSSSDSPAFTSVMDLLGRFSFYPFSTQNFLIKFSTPRLPYSFLSSLIYSFNFRSSNS